MKFKHSRQLEIWFCFINNDLDVSTFLTGIICMSKNRWGDIFCWLIYCENVMRSLFAASRNTQSACECECMDVCWFQLFFCATTVTFPCTNYSCLTHFNEQFNIRIIHYSKIFLIILSSAFLFVQKFSPFNFKMYIPNTHVLHWLAFG